MNVYEGSSSISDNSGNLLFYTNGVYIWNANHDTMPIGSILWGNNTTTQSALIIPKPESTNIYYIFTVDAQAGSLGGYGGLAYSEVDMMLNGGLGGIVSINTPLVTPTTEQVSAVRHCNNKDIWVISHKWNSNEFYSFLVTNNGVDTNAVISAVGTISTGNDANTTGYLKFSPDGKKIARGMWQQGIELYDFNSLTGIVSNPITLFGFCSSCPLPYGVEFSSDGKFLYVAIGFTLLQYDISSNDSITIINSKDTIHKHNTDFTPYVLKNALCLGPDGKIYVAHWQNNFLGVINNPEISGNGCNYQDTGLVLMSGISQVGLPNFITSYFRTMPNFCISYNNSCYGDTTFFAITDTIGVDSVLWDFGDANISLELFPTHIYSDTGYYQIQLTAFFAGTSRTVTDSIYIAPSPSVFSLGSDTLLCNSDTLILQSTTADNFLWQDSSFNSTYIVSQQGTYWVKASIGYCYKTDTILVNYISPSTVNFGNDTTLCTGDSLLLNASNENANYQWQDNSTDSTFTVTDTGTYSVQISNQCGMANDTIVVNYISQPTVNFGNDTILCTGDSLLLIASGENASYQWQNSLTDSIFTVIQSGTYSVQISNQCGTANDTIVVNYISQPTVNFGNDTTLCTGDSLLLIASGENASYQWQNSLTDSIFTVIQSGTYSVQISNQCGMASDTIIINFNPPASLTLGNDTFLCNGAPMLLFANTQNAQTFLWNDGSTDSTFVINNSGTYWVQVSNICGTATDTIVISSFLSPVIFLGNDTTICDNSSLLLSIQNCNCSYLWQDGSNSENYLVVQRGNYRAIASNPCGLASDTISVNFQNCDTIIPASNILFLPNIFSPNGDNKNDIFRVSGTNIKEGNLSIYNRWGEKIYNLQFTKNDLMDITKWWDGTDKGKPLNSAVFVYFCTITYNDGTTETQTGNITLVR